MALLKKDLDLERRWSKLLSGLHEIFGKKPSDLNAVLFIIGVQELGKGPRHFTKEEKQDLMHIAVCKVLSFSDFYILLSKKKCLKSMYWIILKTNLKLILNENNIL